MSLFNFPEQLYYLLLFKPYYLNYLPFSKTFHKPILIRKLIFFSFFKELKPIFSKKYIPKPLTIYILTSIVFMTNAVSRIFLERNISFQIVERKLPVVYVSCFFEKKITVLISIRQKMICFTVVYVEHKI